MQFRIAGPTVLALVTLATGPVAGRAQSIGDFVAYAALIGTPVGALPSAPITGDAALKAASITGRYGFLPAGHGGSNVNHIAVAFGVPTGRGLASYTAGVMLCDGCDRIFGLGADWLVPLTDGDWRAGVRPSIGISKSTDDGDGTIWASALSLPLSWTGARGDKARIVPFVEPGVGLGGITSSGGSENGTRLMLAGGVAVAATESPASLVLSARKIFIDGGKTIYGLGINFAGLAR